MIKCYKDKEQGDGVIVEFEGDSIEITSDLVCIIAKMLQSGIPLGIIANALMLADKYKDNIELG